MSPTLIPASRVVDVQLPENHCLTVPCNTLEAVLAAIISQVCSSEIPTLDFGCLPTSSTPQQLYQSILTKLCELETAVNVTDTFTWTPCMTDGWTCGSPSCVTVAKPCGVTETRDEVIQALSNRVVALSDELTEVCTRLTAAEATIAGLQAQVAALTPCC